ncbi:MAG TPA: IPT/TIG domain-containing protein [Terriglobia bacterium]|nr:IPT/TIG domain-containing protein [Terriglobia bacterium]
MGKRSPISGGYKHHLLVLAALIALLCSGAAYARKSNGRPWGQATIQFAIASITPDSGPTTGGTNVIITGSGFDSSASVSFGGVAAVSVTYISSTQLQVVTPAHASGVVSVAVNQKQNQSATLAGGFTYSNTLNISGISPTSGPATGGTVVTITGTGFQTGASVAFGGVSSAAVTVASSTEINAVSPPENTGTVSITVTNADSQSASLPSAFTFTSGPSISSVTPNSGPVTGGTTVTILGSGFQSGTSVAFGGISAASVKFVSSTELQALTPSSPAGTVAVAVANSSTQTAALAAAFTFFHTVSLAWAASTSSVSGYNVYRSQISGGPYTRINSNLVSGTSFTDSNVQAGNTYFYVTTAVNSSNVESGYSNQATATIPSP